MNRKDKKFWLNLSLKNRDFLTSCANLLLSQLCAITAILISVCSLIISVVGLKNSVISLVIIGVFLSIYWSWTINKYKQLTKGIKNLNDQYQKYLFELYPHMKK